MENSYDLLEDPHYADSPGQVFWITGFSGAGKTDIGCRAVAALRRDLTRQTLFLDGDRLRGLFNKTDAYSAPDRKALAMSYARLCRELALQGCHVVIATISMFDEVRDWNRSRIPRYFEIYVRVPLAVRARRDLKGIYTGPNPTGLNPTGVPNERAGEEPKSPDIILDNHGVTTAASATEAMLRQWRETALREGD